MEQIATAEPTVSEPEWLQDKGKTFRS